MAYNVRRGDQRPAGTFNIGDRIAFLNYVTSGYGYVYAYATVYRKTKNLVYVKTRTKKIKFENTFLFHELFE